MLYCIGGPARVGKSTLAARLMRESNVPFIPTDVLTHALDGTYPQLQIRTGGWPLIPGRWYPFLEEFAAYASLTLPDYCIEGDSFFPEHIARLQRRFKLKACFLGNSSITLDVMLRYAGHNDWVRRCPEEKQRTLAAEIVGYSRMFEKEAKKHGFPYFDVGIDFERGIDLGLRSLSEP